MKELAIIAAVTVVCLCTRVKADAAETTVVVENVEAAQISGFRELWDKPLPGTRAMSCAASRCPLFWPDSRTPIPGCA